MQNRHEKKQKLQTEKIGLGRCCRNVFFMLGKAARYLPGYIAVFCLFQIYCAIQVFFEFTYTVKILLDFITEGASYRQAVAYLLLMFALVLIKLVWAAWMENAATPRAKEILHRSLRMELYQKAAGLDLERYDDPNYYNEFVWSVNEAANRMDLILEDIGFLLNKGAYILISGAFFIALDSFSIFFILLSLSVTLLMNSYMGRIQFLRDTELKPVERKRSYFGRIFYLNDYAKEIRLNPVADRLKKEFSDTNKKVYPIVERYGKKIAAADFIGDYFANDILINAVYLGYLIYQTVVKEAFRYGSTMALYQNSAGLKHSLNDLAKALPRLEQHGLYVEKIRTFLAAESKMQSGGYSGDETFETLTLNNVSFAYGKDRETLHQINLSVSAGEKIAVVGYNGAGKSTLIKLLLRLYDVKEGSILLNGRDIRTYDPNCYRSLFATIFQDYRIFASSIADNVKMDVAGDGDREEIERALHLSGFSERLHTLSNGINTRLTREFEEDGVNLSGGEAQKVAIARTFYQYRPIIILDEPSSALDPISEYQLNQTMLNAAKDKTVLFISHRLSSTVLADRIYMLEKGRIVESGSHQELMNLGGKYAQMFQLQSEKYHMLK